MQNAADSMFARAIHGALMRLTTAILAGMICGGLVLGTSAAAQDDAPAADVPVEQPAEQPVVTEAPPPPPEPTIAPPPEPTVPPPPPPTEAPLPTEAPPTLEPTATSEPTATTEPSPTATPTPSPTPAPEPVLSYTLADQPTCDLAPGQSTTIASAATLEYTCTDTIALNGTAITAATLTIDWNLTAALDGGWSVQLLSPQNFPDEAVEWTPAGAAEARLSFHQRTPAGAESTPADINTTVTINFGLRIQRAACALDLQTLRLEHDVVVTSADAAATLDPPLSAPREPLQISPDLAAIPEPAIAFDGALSFGEVGITATGPAASVTRGTLAATVSGLERACGEWTVRLSSSTLTAESGLPLEGAQLVVVSVNDQAIANGGCDLASGCDLIALAAGTGQPATQTLNLGIELRVPDQPDLGAFSTTLDAVLLQRSTTGVDRLPLATSEGEG